MKKKAVKEAKKKPGVQAQRKRNADSDDIERAVYDGMQDLRVKRKPGKA